MEGGSDPQEDAESGPGPGPGTGRSIADWAPPDRRALVLAVGDHLAIAAVLAYGVVHHGGRSQLFDVGELAETLGPFLVGFLAVAVLAGTYGPANRETLGAGLRAVTVAWVGAVGIGLTLRTTWLVEGGAAEPFALVVAGFGLLALFAWRLAAFGLARVRSGGGQPAG